MCAKLFIAFVLLDLYIYNRAIDVLISVPDLKQNTLINPTMYQQSLAKYTNYHRKKTSRTSSPRYTIMRQP